MNAARVYAVAFVSLVIFPDAWPAPAHPGECREAEPQTVSQMFVFEASPSHDSLRADLPDSATVRSIKLVRLDVFNLEDAEEDEPLYRVANKLHPLTRESVIRSQLLIAEGAAYDESDMQESERLLRNLPFIFDASVRPWRNCSGQVDVEVITRDVWTFEPRFSLSRSGGSNSYNVGVSDVSFFGSGKHFELLRESDDDREGYTAFYGDPAILGSRWRGHANYTDNDDGHLYSLALERPFYALDVRKAGGGRWVDNVFKDTLWFRGNRVSEFDHDQTFVRVWTGFALPRRNSRIWRFRWGWEYEDHGFSFSDDTNRPPGRLPEDREYSYPFIALGSIEDDFAKMTRVNSLALTEDFFVGQQYELQLGWSDDAVTGAGDKLAYRGFYSNTLRADDRELLISTLSLDGFWDAEIEEFENLWITSETRYHHRHTDRWGFFGRLRLEYTDGLTEDRQLTLGGDNGLRGYERNYHVGDRSFLVNLEERYYSDLHLWKLVRVGAAAFIDVGRAWFGGGGNGSNSGVLSNVGVGLRLSTDRARRGRILHIDLAVPLARGNREDNVDDYQLLFNLRTEF